MVDVVLVWFGLPKKSLSHSIFFITVTGSPAIIGSLWTVTDHEPGLSSKYDNVPFILQSIFSQKLTDVINHNGSSELLIHFKWYGIVAQSTALFKHTHVHYTYTCTHNSHIHTLQTGCSCKWYILSSLMCAFCCLEKDQ